MHKLSRAMTSAEKAREVRAARAEELEAHAMLQAKAARLAELEAKQAAGIRLQLSELAELGRLGRPLRVGGVRVGSEDGSEDGSEEDGSEESSERPCDENKPLVSARAKFVELA
jgi:hypothetical protein